MGIALQIHCFSWGAVSSTGVLKRFAVVSEFMGVFCESSGGLCISPREVTVRQRAEEDAVVREARWAERRQLLRELLASQAAQERQLLEQIASTDRAIEQQAAPGPGACQTARRVSQRVGGSRVSQCV